MSGVSDGEIVAELVSDMVGDRSFHRATDSLIKFGHTLRYAGIWRLLEALCLSYDLFQYNGVDEEHMGRKRFAETLASMVGADGRSHWFIHPTTALALAFHPSTRRAFIALVAKHRSVSTEHLFQSASAKTVCAASAKSYRPLDGGRLEHLCLRDIYWGRDFDEHVTIFLDNGLAPYVATWHGANELQLRHLSLCINRPKVPFLSTVARIIKHRLYAPTRVTRCGKFLDADPQCESDAPLSDAMIVARYVKFKIEPRSCLHFGMAGERRGAESDIEIWLLVEQYIGGMAPLELATFVKYCILEWLVPRVPSRLLAMRKLERVEACRQRIALARTTKKPKNE